ncbi:MAG: hypothetical protein ACPK85_08500 [Methanosarcina sp.]
MKTHRISTTISQKHWELLKKHAEKYETQQKTLELALESLENCSKKSTALTEEEKFLLYLIRTNLACVIQNDCFKMLIETADIELLQEFFIRDNPVKYCIEFYLQKSLNECSLKEVIDGLIVSFKIANWFNTIDYMDNGNHYTLRMTHNFGFALSKLTAISIESALKTYGAKTESIVSVKIIFMKIFKNQ